jgi:hypothetical protein
MPKCAKHEIFSEFPEDMTVMKTERLVPSRGAGRRNFPFWHTSDMLEDAPAIFAERMISVRQRQRYRYIHLLVAFVDAP